MCIDNWELELLRHVKTIGETEQQSRNNVN